MGKWVIFIGDAKFGVDTICAMNFDGKKGQRYFEVAHVLEVYFDNGFVSFQFDFDGMIKADYSPEELKSLPYDEPSFVLMRYSNSELLKQIVGAADFPKDILIDCDGVDLGLEHIVDESILLNNEELP